MDGGGSDRRGHFSFDGQLKQDDFKQKMRVKDVDASLPGEQGFIVTVGQWVSVVFGVLSSYLQQLV